MPEIAVIGGGASGILAAIAAAENGAGVTIYEKMDRIGKKLLATGNGRCNFTNLYAEEKNYHGDRPEFIRGAVNKFWVGETIELFNSLGIVEYTENEGKTYPYSRQAAAVLDVLRLRLEELGVKIAVQTEIKKISTEKGGFCLTDRKGGRCRADKVIVSTGGRASPQLGSDGSGYELLRSLGHEVTKTFPTLVQVKIKNGQTRPMMGIKTDAAVTVKVGGRALKTLSGEVLFTEYGLSGPPIFSLSRYVGEYKNAEIYLDLMPEFSHEELVRLLTERRSPAKTLEYYLVGMLNKRVGQTLLKGCGIAPLSKKSSELSRAEIIRIAEAIKAWRFETEGTMSWSNAQATAGGISVAHVNPKTMESKLCRGLYITGELLDIDGDCGGFNLQWAWSSGYIAGKSAAEE